MEKQRKGREKGNVAAEYVKTLKSEFTGLYGEVIIQREFQKSWNVL